MTEDNSMFPVMAAEGSTIKSKCKMNNLLGPAQWIMVFACLNTAAEVESSLRRAPRPGAWLISLLRNVLPYGVSYTLIMTSNITQFQPQVQYFVHLIPKSKRNKSIKAVFISSKVVLPYLIPVVVEVKSNTTRPTLWIMRSYFRHKLPCSGGSLIKIATDQCTVSNSGKRQCTATCNGLFTRDPKAKFSLVQIRGRKCIQFTDDRNSTKYALKVINTTNVIFEEQRCDNAIDDSFLFNEGRVGRLYQYKYTLFNMTACLGVSEECGEKLSIIRTNSLERRCLFTKRRK